MTLTSLIGVLIQPSPATAAEPSTLTADVRSGAVTLDWSGTEGAEKYVVIDERKRTVAWSGTGTAAQVPLARGASADLLVAAVDESGAKPVGKALVTNPPGKSGLKPLTAVTTAAGTTLSWAPEEKVSDFKIKGPGRDRTVSAKDSSPQATLGVPLGKSAELEVIGASAEKPVKLTKKNRGSARRPSPGYRYGVKVTPSSIDLSRLTSKAADSLKAGERVASASPITTSVGEYETYIPMKFVDAPESAADLPCEGEWGGPDYWYAGDDRGPGNNIGKYRTRAAIYNQWTDPRHDFEAKHVSATHRYIREDDGSFTYDSKRTASSDGFDINRISNDGKYARNVIDHAVGNPYCSFADIDYSNQQDLYSNGGHWIYGTHDKMPNHQFYRTDFRADGTSSEEQVFHHELESPYCLNPLTLCGTWRYQYVK